jgi:hypothetical protein
MSVAINLSFESLETATNARISTALTVTLTSTFKEVVFLVQIIEIGFDLWFVSIILI